MTQADWDAHIDAINSFAEDAFQQEVTWIKSASTLSKNGEDDINRTISLMIKGIIQYNYFRSWPSDKKDVAGEVDGESCLIYLNLKYLNDMGYLNANNQFKFSPVLDRFVIEGLTYKADGDSQTAQAGDKPILHFIILKREELTSEQVKY